MCKITKIEKLLERGLFTNFIPNEEEFIERMNNGNETVYCGFDATGDTLHLSHAKNIQILNDLAHMGHKVILLFGVTTAEIGDPTDKDSTRASLDRDAVLRNISSWKEQIKHIIDLDHPNVSVRLNSEWFDNMDITDFLGILSLTTMQQLQQRDMFKKRIENNKPIATHEFLYPVLQGFDTVALNATLELCGNDQLFNADMGRTLAKQINGVDKMVANVHLMENPVTGELMSKSKGTGIFLNVTPEEMFGKLMAQPDEMIEVFLLANTRVSLSGIENILGLHPKEAKKIMAFKVVSNIFGSDEVADKARDHFNAQFEQKSNDVAIGQIVTSNNIIDVITELRSCSKSDARRLLSQNAVSVNGDKVSDVDFVIQNGDIIKIGKKHLFKVMVV